MAVALVRETPFVVNTSVASWTHSPITSSAGNVLVYVASFARGSSTNITGITDSAGNTWQVAEAGFVSGTNSRVAIWYTTMDVGPITTMTVTQSTACRVGASLLELSGVVRTSAAAALGAHANLGNSTATTTPPALTVAAGAGDMVVGGVNGQFTVSPTATVAAPFTLGTVGAIGTSSPWSVSAPAYYAPGSAGTYGPAWTLNQSVTTGMVTAAFVAAAASTTSVTDTQAAAWNVAAAISATAAAAWNVSATTTGTVSSTRTTAWDVRAAVTAQAPAAWNVGATLTAFTTAVTTSPANGWTNPTFAYADDSSYVTASPAQNVWIDGRWRGFNFSSIPAGSTINSVTVLARKSETATGRTVQYRGQTYVGGAAVGAAYAPAAVATATAFASLTWTPTLTLAQLQASDFEVSFGVTRTTATALTAQVDYINVTVDYTPSSTTPVTATSSSAWNVAGPVTATVGTAWNVAANWAGSSYVTRTGSSFYLYGQLFTFSGVNLYYAAARTPRVSAYKALGAANGYLATALDTLKTNSGGKVNVIRFWAYQNLATTSGVRDWTALDQVFSVAGAKGFLVIPTLADEWGDVGDGGTVKLSTWFTNDYANVVGPNDIVTYKAWVAEVTARYAAEPSILCWEFINEGSPYTDANGGLLDDATGTAVCKAWSKDIADTVRANDPNHLLLNGINYNNSGTKNYTTGYEDIIAYDGTDVFCYHDYAGATANTTSASDVTDLINLRAKSLAANKPLIVGEVGVRIADAGTAAARATDYDGKLTRYAAFPSGQSASAYAGALPWVWNDTIDYYGSYQPIDDIYDIRPDVDAASVTVLAAHGSTLPTGPTTTPVTATKAAAWDVTGRVTGTLAAAWGVLSTVAATQPAAWSVRSITSTSAGSAWNVLSIVAPGSAASAWNVATQVTRAASAAWDVRTAVASSSVAAWNVSAAVTGTGTTAWNVRALVTGGSVAAWDVRVLVAASAQASWNTAAQVAATAGAAWDVRTTTTATAVVSWNVATSVAQSSATAWGVRQQVLAAVPSAWDTAGSLTTITASATSAWAVQQRITAAAPATWDTLTRINASTDSAWAVRTAVAATVAAGWNVAATVTAATQAGWNVAEPIGKVTTERPAAWGVRETITAPTAAAWSVRSQATTSWPAAWDVLVTVDADAPTGWDVAGIVTAQSVTAWDMAARAVAEATAAWDVSRTVASGIDSRWRVLTFAGEAVDIVVTGTLGPRRWTSDLGSRWTGDVGPRRWTADLQR